MAGLFDGVFGTPNDQALWALGSGLLGVRRGNEGRALMAPLVAFNEAQQEQRRNQLVDLQRRQIESALAEREAEQGFWKAPANFMAPGQSAFPPNEMDAEGSPAAPPGVLPPTMVAQNMMRSGVPSLAKAGFGAMQKEVRPPVVVGKGGVLVDPGTGRPVFANQETPEQWEPLPIKSNGGQMLIRNKATGEIKAVGSGPLVQNILPGQEKAENAAVGKYWGEQYGKIQESGFSAGGKVSRLDRIEQLLTGIETGKLTPAVTEVQAAAKSLGIDIGEQLDAKQAAAALSKEMAMQMRNPAGGAGMPGAMSDADRKFLEQTVPGLAQTPGGNKLIIETNRRLAKRDQQVAQKAAAYRQKNGQLDDGFVQELEQWSQANPLFSDLGTTPAPSGIPYYDKTGKRVR